MIKKILVSAAAIMLTAASASAHTASKAVAAEGPLPRPVYAMADCPAVSPDGRHILYSDPVKGVVVANADGTSARVIARSGDYPVWASNSVVVFVLSHNDGYQTTDASIVAHDIVDGFTITATEPAITVDAIHSAADGKVLFSDVNGNAYSVTVR